MNDLDCTTDGYQELASPTANGGKGWEPIGTFIPMCSCASFTGTFDGQGYEIRDLYISRPDEYLVGLFGCVYDTATLESVTVSNATVIGKSTVGSLVGRNMGNISHCSAITTATGLSNVGGLVGYNQGPVSECYAIGNVVAGGVVGDVGAVMGGFGVGGLIGVTEEASVSNCYFTGNVTSYLSCPDKWKDLAGVGGLAGVNYATVSNSYSIANVVGKDGVGGLVGRNIYGGLSSSYFSGCVTGNSDVGGLMGSNEGDVSVTNSFYNYDEVLINGQNIILVGALFDKDFDEWLANDKFLEVNERLSLENGYYVVSNVSDFKQLLAFGQDPTLRFRLTNDLDLGYEPDFYIPYLSGEFDGNGHKISNLSLNYDSISPLGLFGYIAPGGKVTDLGLENVNVTGHSGVGGLVGAIRHGTVSHCYSTGKVSGNFVIGGLVGANSFGIVSAVHSAANVTGCSVVGGLLGANAGTVSNSYSTGRVVGNAAVGGLVGDNDGTVGSSYCTGSVSGDQHIGGLVGVNAGLGSVSNSYCTGTVSGNQYVGGLIGCNGDRGTVSNCYSTGSVAGTTQVGGLVGRNYFGYGAGTISNSFWDVQTSGQSTSDGGTGKPTAQMKEIGTFSATGWNIVAVALHETKPSYIWNIVNNVTYPFLSWQPL